VDTRPGPPGDDGVPIVYAVLARVPDDGTNQFSQYEAAVLPLLPAHGGKLERRMRNADGTVELHLVSFPSAAAFERYRDDPGRRRHLPLLEQSRASQELFELHDLE